MKRRAREGVNEARAGAQGTRENKTEPVRLNGHSEWQLTRLNSMSFRGTASATVTGGCRSCTTGLSHVSGTLAMAGPLGAARPSRRPKRAARRAWNCEKRPKSGAFRTVYVRCCRDAYTQRKGPDWPRADRSETPGPKPVPLRYGCQRVSRGRCGRHYPLKEELQHEQAPDLCCMVATAPEVLVEQAGCIGLAHESVDPRSGVP